jgi:hypothetical protein
MPVLGELREVKYAFKLTNFTKAAFGVCLRYAFSKDITPIDYRYSEKEGDTVTTNEYNIEQLQVNNMFVLTSNLNTKYLIIEKQTNQITARNLTNNTNEYFGYGTKVKGVQPGSKIQIYTEFPRRSFHPPIIVVHAGAGDVSLSALGDEFLQENRDETGAVISYTTFGKMTIPIEITAFALTTTDRERIIDMCAFYIRHIFRPKLAEYGIAYNKITTGGETQVIWDNQPLLGNSLIVNCYTEFENVIPVDFIEGINSLNLIVEADKENYFYSGVEVAEEAKTRIEEELK